MNQNICIFPSLFLLLFAGCNSSSSSSSGSSSSNSQTEVAATVNSTSAPEVFSNFTLELNPVIVITGNTATYKNDDGSQGFELATSTLTDVSVKYDDTPDGGGLLLIFTSPSFSDGNITITLSGFVDRGNEGYIDEFTVEKAEVNKNDGTTTEITSVANTKKSNLGTKLKRSASDMTENNISLPDFSGSPTVDEWNKYMIGTAILATELSGVGELTLVQFTSSSTGRYIDVAGYDAGDSGTFTYIYSQDGSNKGILTTTSTWVESDQTDSNYNDTIEEVDVRCLTFTDFYNGKYENTAGTETNLANGSVKNDTAPFDYGSFNTITDVEIYLSDNKITLSTN
jgi:hypothetical protein